jgi:hypothetical protein
LVRDASQKGNAKRRYQVRSSILPTFGIGRIPRQGNLI